MKYIVVFLLLFVFSLELYTQEKTYLGKTRDYIREHYPQRFPERDTSLVLDKSIRIIKKENSEMLAGKSVIWKFDKGLCNYEIRMFYYKKRPRKAYREHRKKLEKLYEYSKEKNLFYYFVGNSITVYIKLTRKKKRIMEAFYSSSQTLKFLKDRKQYD